MSSNGYMRAQLEKQRREQLLLQQQRIQCSSLLAACRETIRSVNDPVVQQLIGRDLKVIQAEMAQVSQQINAEPVKAKKVITKLQKHLNKVVADGQAEAGQWSRKQAQAQADIQAARQNLQAQKQAANQAGQQVLAQAQEKIDQANSLYQSGSYEKISGVCAQATSLTEQAGQKTFDESVRREVVSGLLSTLTNMGFVVDQPTLEGKDPATGVVKLTGRMPSGRMASFEVNLDGRMNFDFDGYEGRVCGKDLEVIDKTLQQQFAVKLGEAQVNWKNPDKIAKGARNLPAGHRNKTNH